jgi:hypothetical protein
MERERERERERETEEKCVQGFGGVISMKGNA